MHIDNKQFLELLAETSGIESEKVRKQIEELTEEISQALSDGEAYEIEGFGIFSKIGNRVLFIPSKELETEINFKYVGMEPIELEADQTKKEEKEEELKDPFEELQNKENPSGRKRDPFAGLIDDFDDEEPQGDEGLDDVMIFGVETRTNLEEEENPGPEQWGIEAHKEDSSGADKLLSHLIGKENEDDKPVFESEDDDDLSDIFGEEENQEKEESSKSEEDSVLGLDEELSNWMSDDDDEKQSVEGLEAGMLDEGLEDIFGEEESDDDPEPLEEPILELNNDLEEEKEEVVEEEIFEELEPEGKGEEQEEIETKSDVEEIDMDDFDDPFAEFEEESEEEQQDEEQVSDEEIVPVITNISSDIDLKKEEAPKKPERKAVKKKEAQPIAAWLWMVLGLVVIIGATVGLAYFKVISIPGITPQVASTTIPTVVIPPVTENTPAENQKQPEETETTENATPPPVQEQEQAAEVPEQTNTASIPSGQAEYGINGVVNDAANNGYTIVLYSLSVEKNAMSKQRELSSEGFRALVTPISSTQYGTLWRVSIGQFATLTDAAIAGEALEGEYKGNYFIKKIIN